MKPPASTPFRKSRLPVAVFLALLLASASLFASTSNKWRMEFSGKAHSDGTIVVRISPEDGEPITAEIAIANKTGENAVAKTVVKGLKAQLPKDHFKVERDDGEDVLVKKKFGTSNFGLELISNDVKNVRINLDKE
jgi:hypothetical protein